MVSRGRAADHRRMTTEQPAAPRPLRRRGDDRVLGGVASGLADYFNVDPLLVRIGFVGLMVFNGLGLGLYLLAWLLVPTDTDGRSVVQRVFGDSGVTGRIAAIVVILLGAVFLYNLFPQFEPRQDFVELAIVALVVIGIGAVLFRRPEPNAIAAETGVAADAVTAPETDTMAAAPPLAPAPQPVVVRRPSRPPSPLGWYVLGAMLIGIGLLAMTTVVSGGSVDIARYFGLALTTLGVGLVIGTWYGHARLLILLGFLLLPFAIAAGLITVPFEGGFGSLQVQPASAADLDEEYRLAGGQIYMDLSQLEDEGEQISIDASVAMGDLLVVLPEDAGAEMTTSVGAGTLLILGDADEGTNLERQDVIEGDGPQFVLDLGTGLGIVRVETREVER